MTNMTMGDAAYRALLSRWSSLKRTYPAAERTQQEKEAAQLLDELSARLDAAELAGGCIADAVDDYAFSVGEAGNLSGVELV